MAPASDHSMHRTRGRALRAFRTRLLSATVYLTDIANKAQMDAEWCEWIGGSANWPQRACVQAELAPGTLVEITVVAARPRPSVP